MPAVSTVMDWVVAPLDQVFPVGLLLVKVMLSPVHKAVDPLGVIVGVVGNGITVTTVGNDVEVHPKILLRMTV